MALEPTEKLREILSNTRNPLILIPENPNGDSISAAWALSLDFERRGIKAPVAFSDPRSKASFFSFLPRPKEVLSKIVGARDFVLIFNTQRNPITNVRTETLENELRIYLTPDRALIEPRDFSFVPANCKYDVLIALGCRDKDSLGKIYEDNADIFYEIPIVNIDYHANNEEFGQVNVINMTASSVSEIIAELLFKDNNSGLSESVAHCLLSGIISETDSYQRKNTTPQSLHISARLIECGAKQQEIIRHLYKTQPFNLLKLLGRVMANLNWNESTGIVWANVTIEDFVQTRTTPSDLSPILDKIRSNYSAGKFFCALYRERGGNISGLLKASREESLKIAHGALDGKWSQDLIEFTLDAQEFKDAEKTLIAKLSDNRGS
jgi:nanoRNase/pAp phosphatase (c-di-AMP/oligoRNAs hydrolase)